MGTIIKNGILYGGGSDASIYQYVVDSKNPELQPVSGLENTYSMTIPNTDWEKILEAKTSGKIVVIRLLKLYDQVYGDDGLVIPLTFAERPNLSYCSGFGQYMEEPGGLSENKLVVVTMSSNGTTCTLYLQYFISPKNTFIVSGGWRYRINQDNTFEAYYQATKQTYTITNASGNLYRSELQTLSLPSALSTANIIHASVNVAHNNYPTFGMIASLDVGLVNFYAMSGSSRTSSPNYLVTAQVFGTL